VAALLRYAVMIAEESLARWRGMTKPSMNMAAMQNRQNKITATLTTVSKIWRTLCTRT
jgi:hypothetical protein